MPDRALLSAPLGYRERNFSMIGASCPTCSTDAAEPLADMGETDDSEQVEIEFTVYRRRIRRRRYRKTCNCPGQQTLTAPKPPKLIPKSRYGNSLWVHLLLEKFHTGRPINRTIDSRPNCKRRSSRA